jgi:hypothetical protein
MVAIATIHYNQIIVALLEDHACRKFIKDIESVEHKTVHFVKEGSTF